MDRAFLEELGLDVTDADGVVEARLELRHGAALNPLTRTVIDHVTFTCMGDRLLYVGPQEFVGAQPINLAFLTPGTPLEDLVIQTLSDHLYQLERRSNELSALGLAPRVDPASLQLSASVSREPFTFLLGASRAGQFRVVKAEANGHSYTSAEPAVFELSEFRSREALADFLFAMFSDIVPRGSEPALPVAEVFAAFGDAVLAPMSALELVADLQVGNERLRFAAARVQGRVFRGLLAGPSGKIWAERFELDDFPGVRALVAELLQVPLEDVEV
jgi:hypothetical protein